MGDDGGGHSGFGQGRGGNDGMSGAPMWQIKKKMTHYEQQREQMVKEYMEEKEKKERPAEPPNVLVDAISAGESKEGKPLVRHVLVKDLNRVAALKREEFPTTGIFADKAPIGLYAIFDGHSCAGVSGPIAADFCARNFHTKMMANLKMLRPEAATETFVKAAIIKSFHDLDAELLVQHRDVHQGCGAAVSLLIGDHLFVAVLGRCGAVLVEAEGGKSKPVPLGASQSKPTDPTERVRLQRVGAVVVPSPTGGSIRHPSGALSPVSRSLGDPLWKGAAGGGVGPELLIPTPEVVSVELKGHEKHPCVWLMASSVAGALSPEDMTEIATEFPKQPRLASGEAVGRAQEALKAQTPSPQCVAAQVCFLPVKEKAKASEAKEPPAKKLKTGEVMNSMRLRHILLRISDGDSKPNPAAAKAAARKPEPKPEASRTRVEAEAVLRKVMIDIKKDSAKAKTPKNVTELVVQQGKVFAEKCRELSECPSAKKGGTMCGDLGWMSGDEMTRMGGTFREKVQPLKPGQWSDITPSDQGLHLIQRIA